MIGVAIYLAATLPPAVSRFDLRTALSFSNLCISRETNDISGVRVFIRRRAPRVLVQVAEGGLGELQVAVARYERGSLLFELKGDALDDSVSGRFRNGVVSVRTHRRRASWVVLPRRAGIRAPYCS